MILIRNSPGEAFAEPAVKQHPSEQELQQQILDRPSLLPTQPTLAVVDELTIPQVGRVDILGVAEDGHIWIVECKLAANPQIRREIVGQVLAYAGGLWRMSYEEFSTAFSSRAKKPLLAAVEQAVQRDVDADNLVAGVRDSLDSGRFTLVLAVDRITDELKKIIEFLDQQTVPEVRVMALEMAYYKHGTIEVLTPVTYGDQLSKPAPRPPTEKWTEERFVGALAAFPDEAVREALLSVLDHGRQKGHHPFWGSGAVPGMSYYYVVDGKECPVWAMYLKSAGPVVAVSFGSLAHVSPAKALAVLEALQGHPTFSAHFAHVDPAALNKYPNMSADLITAPEDRRDFLTALELALT